MELERFFIWQDWPAEKQKLFFAALVAALAFVLFLIWSGLHESQLSAGRTTLQSKLQYSKTVPLVEQLKAGEASRGALIDREPMTAAQQVARDLGLDNRLTSIRPLQAGSSSGEGVQVVLEALNLPEVVSLMRDFNVRGGLKVTSFTINHRLDSPDLADVQIILVR
ncbi:Type II secretion system (T2SS), protein M [Maridesulfovibrio ferrireducens]|uniref:Type II secretion system (T2SS), protein M n=1 Tax=Maridesulfovibrio ferrireducens TaxID=246191 RepID=A0A1G9CT07_9BACT|nr:type II secretion system protein GspM [Maridesulfovibrio ferrireducens]SDK54796.1 Type II secretion system (T2SS), protein M [Maridesulfovibrio ferrireducens]